LRASDEKRASEERVRFEEFDALAERGHDLFQDPHVVVRSPVGYGGEGAVGFGRVAG
jgi:hypothetical protein